MDGEEPAVPDESQNRATTSPKNATIGTSTPARAPFDWLKWIPIGSGFLFSTLALITSVASYRLAHQAHEENTVPKLVTLNAVLTEAKVKRDVPVISYQIQNMGSLPVLDVHAYLTYTVQGPLMSKFGAPISTSNMGTLVSDPGATIAPGDHIDRSALLLLGSVNGNVPSLAAITSSRQSVVVDIHVDASDYLGKRLVTCSRFNYEANATRFERTADCRKIDITSGWRSPDVNTLSH